MPALITKLKDLSNLSVKLVIPILAFISMMLVSKWWYVVPLDGPHTMMYGFPFPYTCRGWHTSMSNQLFIGEFVLDYLIYLLFWIMLSKVFARFFQIIKTHIFSRFIIFSAAVVVYTFAILIAVNPDNLYYLKRPFEIEVVETEIHVFSLPERVDRHEE